MTTRTSLQSIPHVSILVDVDGKPVNPCQNGYIGVIQGSSKIEIMLVVAKGIEHSVYTRDYNLQRENRLPVPNFYGDYSSPDLLVIGLMKEITGSLTYKRSFLVVDDANVEYSHVAGYPNNTLYIEINNKTFEIGIVSQNGRFFFFVYEAQPPKKTGINSPVGTVKEFNPLRGVAVVHFGKGEDARVYWKNLPWRRSLGLRFVSQGDVLDFDPAKAVKLDSSNTTFSVELPKTWLAKR